MEFDSIDISEMEKQRYEAIKRSGEYVELNVLIGVETDILSDGNETKSPVITTSFRNCGPKEVACLYVTLNTIMKTLEKKYPMECFLGKMSMHVEDLGSINSNLTEEDDDEED